MEVEDAVRPRRRATGRPGVGDGDRRSAHGGTSEGVAEDRQRAFPRRRREVLGGQGCRHCDGLLGFTPWEAVDFRRFPGTGLIGGGERK